MYFLLIKKKIYPVKKDNDAIRYCNCCGGPQFYSSTIYLNKQFLSTKSSYVGSVNDKYERFSSNYELNNGIQYFKALDVEVYQILFDWKRNDWVFTRNRKWKILSIYILVKYSIYNNNNS